MQSASKVLIVVPCYNEQENIQAVMNKLNALECVDYSFIICAVNDGSTDRTEEVLKEKFSEQFVSHASNTGVSGVILTGIMIAKKLNCKYLVQFDGDDQHPSDKIIDLVRFAERNKADLAIGSRFASTQSDSSSTPLRRFGIKLIRLFLECLTHVKIKDPTSGFRVYNETAQKILYETMPESYPEPESIAILLTKNKKIIEMPVSMSARQAGESTLTGIQSVLYMIRVISSILGIRLRNLFLF